MTKPTPSDRDPPAKRVPTGERSIDFGAQLAREAQKKIRETGRLQALSAKEAAEARARTAGTPSSGRLTPPPRPPSARLTPPPRPSPPADEDLPRESLVNNNKSGAIVRPPLVRPKLSRRKKLIA